MTLNQTIINRWGAWQSSDHRTVDLTNGQVIDDYSVKQVILRCPDGAALLAYAGASRMSLGGAVVEVSDWIREMLRGETRTLDQSLILIRENATRDLAPALRAKGILHMFSIAAFLAGQPWAVQIRNFTLKDLVLLDHFETAGMKVPDSGLGFVYGDPRAINLRHGEKLMALAKRKPRQPKEFRNALASMNRRVAETPSGRRTISPGCFSSYMPPKGEPFESEVHGVKAAPGPLIIPTLLFGIDLTDIQRTMLQQMRRPGALSTSPESTGLALQQERSAKESVVPRNRLWYSMWCECRRGASSQFSLSTGLAFGAGRAPIACLADFAGGTNNSLCSKYTYSSLRVSQPAVASSTLPLAVKKMVFSLSSCSRHLSPSYLRHLPEGNIQVQVVLS